MIRGAWTLDDLRWHPRPESMRLLAIVNDVIAAYYLTTTKWHLKQATSSNIMNQAVRLLWSSCPITVNDPADTYP